MAASAAEVIVPADGTQVQLAAGVAVTGATVLLFMAPQPGGQRVFIGPTGVTPNTGFQLTPGKVLSLLGCTSAVFGITADGKAIGVRVYQLA